MIFLESPRFPENISYGSSGGPRFSTDVVAVKSGFKNKNQNWTEALHEYNAIEGVKSPEDFAELKNFFMAVAGRFGSFRFKDWADYKSSNFNVSTAPTDQEIGQGDGATAAFQLVKSYTAGALTTVRTIKKPVVDTVTVAIGDVQTTDRWSVNTTTGIVSFDNDVQVAVTAATNTNPVELTFNSAVYNDGDFIYLSGFTGDWAALNGQRLIGTAVTGTRFTFPVDATSFTTYSSNGGQGNTLPQTGETIKAGYEFDVPVECDSDLMLSTWDNFQIQSLDLPLMEIRL